MPTSPPLTVLLLARALYAEWRALDTVNQYAAVEEAWQNLCAKRMESAWLTKAASVLAWLPVLAAPPEETTP